MPVEVVTLGCRLNTFESEGMRKAAREAGHDDLVIVNTCAVTAEAVRQARQTIRRLRRDNPGSRIIVTGCAAQTEPETFAAMPEVTQVIGNDIKLKGETWVEAVPPQPTAFGLEALEKVRVNDIMSVRETQAIWLMVLRVARGRSCRSRMAATIAAPSASFVWARQFPLGADGGCGQPDQPAG